MGCIGLQEIHGGLPAGCDNWIDAFGKIYADVQIHMMERGFVNALAKHGAGDLVYRYRIEWRAKCIDRVLPPSWGASHGSDMAIWFFGNGQGLLPSEKALVKNWIAPVVDFLKGEPLSWESKTLEEVRRLRVDGSIDVWHDQLWDEGVRLWEELRAVGSAEKRPLPRL
jgi:carboxylesterase type B